MRPDASNSIFIKPVRNKSLHPLGLRDYIPEGSAVAGSHNRDEFWDRTLGDSRVYILNSVQPSTMDQYKVGVKHFFDFIVIFGTDRLLTTKPVQWYRNPHLQVYTFLETVVMSFLAYLASDPGVEPKTAIEAQRAGMVNLWRAKRG